MNQIAGYDTIPGGRKFPRFSGPCKGCGAENYGLSTSGPDYCASCACGVPPAVSKLRRELDELHRKYTDALLAISALSGHKPPFNAAMSWRAQEFIRRFKTDENLIVGQTPADLNGTLAEHE